MIVNIYEYKIIFSHQFVNAIQNVTFTVIQPRRMFKKGVMVDVQEFIILVCSCAICMPYVCFSGDTVWDTEEMLLHGVSGTSTSLNQGWNT